MSRAPPLPLGPPPQSTDDFYRPGMNRYNNDRYPAPPGTNGRDFQFQANLSHPPPMFGRTDSYQPRQYHGEPGRAATNSYRPPQGDFTYRHDAPGFIIENSHNIEPSVPRPTRVQNHTSDRRGGYNQRSGYQGSARGRGNSFRGRGGISSRAAERPMLQSTKEPTPELMEGMDNEDNEAVRYRSVEILSDSDEAEMNLSSENGQATPNNDQEPEQPRKKQAKMSSSKAVDGDSVPRWSNPDPYTALPPPDESQRKKKDVVKLIRKSRVVSSTEDVSKPDVAADDFISFDLGDEDDADESINSPQNNESHTANNYGNGVPGAPSGPRDHTLGQRNVSTSFSHRDSHQRRMAVESAPSKDHKAGEVRLESQKASDPALGSRKRTVDDEIKDDRSREDEAPRRPQKQVRQMRSGRNSFKEVVAGDVIDKWLIHDSTTHITSSPWCETDHSKSSNMGFWLHKEIMNFYEFVKPRPFEDQLRTRLVDNLRLAVKRTWGDDADICPFGSFPAGLYLPTADMDLVLLSKEFRRGGYGWFKEKDILMDFGHFLRSNGFAVPGSIEIIAAARVPLVKYVDAETQLKVDVSFENMTGITANDTFQAWKKQHSAMPIIVTLIKQFLAMRGLNEPVNGGIGGFTVTCLVTSLLQNLPSVQSGNLVPEHHLNEILMEFFNLYGNEFNTTTTAIQLNPPGYITKRRQNQAYKQNNTHRLSVIDPNNSENDIAGGSKNTATILDSFSKAYDDLVRRMGDLHYSEFDKRQNQSILSVIIGGDYSSFKYQREHLAQLYDQLDGSGP